MWSIKSGLEKTTPAKPSRHNAITLIASGTEVEGNIRFRGTVHVEGSIKGNVTSSDGLLQLIEGSSVDGNINAAHVIINGRVTGDVYATERLELSDNAQVEGNVYYDVMEMVAGAAINGKMERMHKSGELLLKKEEQQTIDVKKLEPA